MITDRWFEGRDNAWPAIVLTAAGIGLVLVTAVVVARVVAGGDMGRLSLGVLALGLVTIVLAGAANWRTGLYFFLAWLLFEDLPRKFLGNNMVIYFGKDVLIAMTYVGFALAWRKGGVPVPRLSFAAPFGLFLGLGLLQVFNPYSPSMLYGLLGVKVYFYYVPLVFIGYALFRTQQEMGRFFILFAALALVIAVLGIIQGIVGLDFLNPAVLAPELESMGRQMRVSPITGLRLPRATSIFVSEGRQGSFMFLAFLLCSGSAVFLGTRGARWWRLVLLTAAVTFSALMLHGSRAGVLYGTGSLLVLAFAFVWLWHVGERSRPRVAVLVAGVVAIAALVVGGLMLLFPQSVAARWAFYAETLSPWSPSSQLAYRAIEYPLMNLRGGLEAGHLLLGRGIGTASLGVVYVQMLFGTPPPPPPVESGFGTLVLELGILGPLLWLAWGGALVWSGARIVWSLRRSAAFPVGVSILWFAFVLLFPLTYGALSQYQNYLFNAVFWLMVGVLWRLPHLTSDPAPVRDA